jgi:hypothetical protein
MKNLKPFMDSSQQKNDEVYEVVTDRLIDMRSRKLIEDWVEQDNLFLDEEGNVYGVEHYDTQYYGGPDYGYNTVVESEPDFKSAVLVITYPEIMSKIREINKTTA